MIIKGISDQGGGGGVGLVGHGGGSFASLRPVECGTKTT